MRHVIVGAGPAGVIAAETLRKVDANASITIIGDEAEPPYSRMAIPYLLAEHIGEEGTYLRHASGHYKGLDIDVRRGRVETVRARDHTLTLGDGSSLAWDRLLIATGSRASRPPLPGMDLPGVENCWTLADARRIAERAKPGSRVVLMGAGFIGCIVLEALAARRVDLTVIETEDRMLPRMMDETGGDMIKRWCERHGLKVLTATSAQGIEPKGDALQLSLDDGTSLAADLVVCATGVRPDLDLLDGTGVETDVGVLVNEHLETNVAGIFAAGDVAQGPDLSTGRREVHAIQPTASEHGRIAARNMAGLTTPFGGSLSMNVLNTVGLISSSFGLWRGVDGGERSVAADADRFKYLRLEFADDRIVGALALGLTQHVGVIRGLIQTRVRLGTWKDTLMRNPHRVMEAYLDCTQGTIA
ncbi:MAG: FAD-dependent oxidoreductase [Gammaproteobacteria bacterium]|nr:FAD-dependent oxidoreductase [Gammaproteobacteria bacterium]NIR83156.1 FAD-dependent oxidoreductase [Gammaproteobacteria bacterium]NIR90964.1 FAD-dependent oxidoreductase [Gammaproteobacteria bacterium]NIU04321.1 FAD-dependent oxidoreductase [Gammaproteobacteria bacterium]NIV52544.1 FAD-dependent oxidoreductase [Gammaproteobacteria bacterium]